MARKRSSSADASDIANELDSLLLDPTVMSPLQPLSPFSLPDLEDNRQFHPEAADRPPRSFHTYTEFEIHAPRPVRPAAPRRKYSAFVRPAAPARTRSRHVLPSQIRFKDSDRVAICVRRRRRKEVLHALRKTLRGRGGSHRRYTKHSQVRC